MQQWIADLITPVADHLNALVCAIPLGVVRGCFLMIFVLLGVWVLALPPQRPRGGRQRLWEDLRYLALGVLLLQSAIYIIF